MFKPNTMYQPQQTYYQQPVRMQPGLKGYPVSSLEEARAAVVDFDGSIFIFPDVVNKRIYTKQINIDGTATLNMYELKEFKEETKEGFVLPSVEKFVTKDELAQVLAEFRQSLDEKIVPAPAAKSEVMAF